MSPPDPGPDTGATINTSFSSSVAGSERTVINVQERQETSGAGCWTNTLDSNMTDTSVDEPKYAKVQHKKRNSKIGSGNSTPKFKRKETIDSGSSRFVAFLGLSCYWLVASCLQLFPVKHFVNHEAILCSVTGSQY